MNDACGKVRYPGEREADKALKKIRRSTRGNPGKKRKHKECRAYHCRHCNGWHLTSRRHPDAR